MARVADLGTVPKMFIISGRCRRLFFFWLIDRQGAALFSHRPSSTSGEKHTMQRSAHLFLAFIAPLVGLVGLSGAVAAESDIVAQLSDRTFLVVEAARGKAVEKRYHAYFKGDGTMIMKYNPSHSKSVKWQVPQADTLCITARREKQTGSDYITRCGRLRKEGESRWRWDDDRGEQRADFRLLGRGDRLP